MTCCSLWNPDKPSAAAANLKPALFVNPQRGALTLGATIPGHNTNKDGEDAQRSLLKVKESWEQAGLWGGAAQPLDSLVK